MTQTSLMLEEARSSYIDTLNLLTAVRLHTISATTEDMMLAYFITTEWCMWCETPNMEGSPLAGKRTTAASYASVLKMMLEIKEDLEIQLAAEMDIVEMVFESLNPNLIEVGKNIDSPAVKESTRRYYKMLKCTADFFKDKIGCSAFSNILEN